MCCSAALPPGPDYNGPMATVNRRDFTRAASAAAGRALLAAPAKPKIDDVLRHGMEARRIPAVVAMFANGHETLYQGAFGTRDTSGVAVRTDSIFSIASMTKAIASVAALQLVERGKLRLDEPVARFLPQLAKPQVLDGFENNVPRFRPARTALTLRHLLTHTSGFCYSRWDADMFRYSTLPGLPQDALQPLMFEPGTRWQYGEGIDWAGRLVEAISGLSLEAYCQTNILQPLAMHDTSFILPAAKFERLVSLYDRDPADGLLKQRERKLPEPPKIYNGGGGLYSTVADYTRFLQMILGNGARGGTRVLQPETVASLSVNQLGPLTAGKMKSFAPQASADVDIQPGHKEKWSLAFLINTTAYPGGRSAGSLAWAGLYNTFYWLDPKRSVCGVIMMQFLPFVDKEAVGMLNDFERAAYASL